MFEGLHVLSCDVRKALGSLLKTWYDTRIADAVIDFLFFPPEGLFGSFSWSDVRFWGRDVYLYREALRDKFVICEIGLYK